MSQHISITNTASATRAIYDEYAGLLLGYIFEVVKDKNIAEEYLVAVFKELPQHLHDVMQPGTNTYQRLLLLTRKVLADFFATIPACDPADKKAHLPAMPNKFLERMSEEEQFIFCNVHYNGKSISALARELNRTEQAIKKILQQAFAAIRRAA
ncbi:sigma-70 family RNA polymerase sigma factor [Mucilaginibacter mali]|uniref:Sigma-70 family RNA polymerase sigma factor n=1 Tax=Mucilaginibacter mali TaxID=2740462 RepID=A0A7D4TUF9_9SPHI|nr:sigma-70 family RNA polymerase sigma factor [Mucilaginibacter mali]QKJ29735.1 sigma-70 family RNA polymerase sigma factor [Mucilaginibacter mali]